MSGSDIEVAEFLLCRSVALSSHPPKGRISPNTCLCEESAVWFVAIGVYYLSRLIHGSRCQFSPHNVPVSFTQSVPGVFTQSVPLFGVTPAAAHSSPRYGRCKTFYQPKGRTQCQAGDSTSWTYERYCCSSETTRVTEPSAEKWEYIATPYSDTDNGRSSKNSSKNPCSL